eukprot:11208034-Lingulodinium_polyedra.AAC.1
MAGFDVDGFEAIKFPLGGFWEEPAFSCAACGFVRFKRVAGALRAIGLTLCEASCCLRCWRPNRAAS